MRVAVLICVYNNPDGLRRTLDSLRGEAGDFTVVVVDDGSPAAAVINAADYSFPIHLHRLPQNGGIEYASNKAAAIAHRLGAEFIARIDAGDLWVPGRLALQLAALDADPKCVVVGCAAEAFYPNGEKAMVIRHPSGDADIRRFMHINSAFANVTTLIRLSTVIAAGGYPINYPAAEDYALYWRLLRIGEGMNLDIIGTRFEYANPASISNRRYRAQQVSRLRLQLRYFDPVVKESYQGLARSLIAILVPRKLLQRFKKILGLRGANITAAE